MFQRKQRPSDAVKDLKKRGKEEDFLDVARRLRLYKERLTVHLIDIERISPADRVRSVGNVTQLSASIRRYGLLQPLTVRRVCSEETPMGGVYTLLCGARRLEALKQLGIKQAPCYIFDTIAGQTQSASAAAKLSEQPYDLFDAVDVLAELWENGISEDELCKTLCLTRERVRVLRACAQLDVAERALCRKLEFPEQLIIAIARLPQTERAKAIAECATCLRQLLSSYQQTSPPQHGVYVSILPFYNSVDRLTAQMRSAGFAAHADKTEDDDAYIVTITLPKRSARVITPDVKQSS